MKLTESEMAAVTHNIQQNLMVNRITAKCITRKTRLTLTRLYLYLKIVQYTCKNIKQKPPASIATASNPAFRIVFETWLSLNCLHFALFVGYYYSHSYTHTVPNSDNPTHKQTAIPHVLKARPVFEARLLFQES